MDLGANAQIDKLQAIAEASGIDVPSLRGYRLMGEEAPLSDEEIEEIINDAVGTCWWLFSSNSDPEWYEHTWDEFVKGYRPQNVPPGQKYCYPEQDDQKKVRKKKIHTTSIFQEVGMVEAMVKRQYMLWNRYAGRGDVLYIHSRMGGDARVHQTYEGEYARWNGFDARDQPWYLDSCPDANDPTYCDIYARISAGGIE